jgi:Zn-dependent protease
MSDQSMLLEMLYRVPVLLLSFTIHELSHALVAYRCGDMTAKLAGRITLNPLKHIDPIGALMLIVARFGWAKPVPINPSNFKKRKPGIVLTSLAGPVSNIVLAFLFSFVYLAYLTSFNGVSEILLNLFNEFIVVNVSLAAFNLIPIPPLDGSKVLFAALPDRIYFNYVLRYERYGMIALMVLSFTGLLGRVIGPIANTLFSVILNTLLPLFR